MEGGAGGEVSRGGSRRWKLQTVEAAGQETARGQNEKSESAGLNRKESERDERIHRSAACKNKGGLLPKPRLAMFGPLIRYLFMDQRMTQEEQKWNGYYTINESGCLY